MDSSDSWSDGDEDALEDRLRRIAELRAEIKTLEINAQQKPKAKSDLPNYEDIDWEAYNVPEHAIPIRSDVRDLDWERLVGAVGNFDVITMDPPWVLAGAAPTRGVALGYSQLRDDDIRRIPIDTIQSDGFLFIWVVNKSYTFAFDLLKRWGYTFVDEITWVKRTINRRLAKGHGYYLQHAKETCIVGKKGKDPPNLQRGVGSDVIWSDRRGQSQKPDEIYELIEQLVPNGRYLEIFGRKNNLRDYWVTVGNEL